jgi:hypothetical protein
MMMFNILKIAIALGLLFFVFFGNIPDSIDINLTPDEIDEVQSIIDVEKPSEDIIGFVRPIAKIITDIEDKAKIALFNYEFANRLDKYNTDVQQLNDVYVLAGKEFFGDSMRGKYANFASSVENLFKSIVTNDNHTLTDEEKTQLKKLFMGLSWALIER